ncbi:MAG: nitrate reductase subunit alpha [Fibrobacteres bacterium]|nr:nitrate reductase subunit alpha [Fibrobacterota bacterium]
MSFFRKLRYFGELFADGHGATNQESRAWEESYRRRWAHDKVVRSTHGVNCTGSCSWKVFVKNGLVAWEMQQTDYPRTRPDLPDHEPRGCPRGASYSWYLYSAHRVKYPLVRSRLLRLWREAKRLHSDPVDAWAWIQADPERAQEYRKVRGHGGFVRTNWEEAMEIVAAANVHTVKTHGPDRVVGFSPIPAMSMVSFAAGSRYLSLLGGACLSFYDWYCDLPVASPQTWGEQTDVPESADWFNSGYTICWGSNVPLTRTPDAHFLTESRYRGAKIVAVTPDFSEVARLSDEWLAAHQGTDAALAMAMQRVVMEEFHLGARKSPYFEAYVKANSDLPMLVRVEKNPHGDWVPGRFLRASDLTSSPEANNPQWKTVAWDEVRDAPCIPLGSIGFRWGEQGRWNIEPRSADGSDLAPQLSFHGPQAQALDVAFPYFGSQGFGEIFPGQELADRQMRRVAVRMVATPDGEVAVATVFDLLAAHLGIDRDGSDLNLRDLDPAKIPYTPEWQEPITGVKADVVRRIAREFAENAHATQGRSMVIIGASVNHWYHSDMSYRAIISLLVLCGTVGKSGGGWAHYVGQEKLRPQSGWAQLAFALDWNRPPRHQNTTSFWYLHTDQWRYETLKPHSLLSPTGQTSDLPRTLVDSNVQAERRGWLPSAPQLNRNPLGIAKAARDAGLEPKEFVVQELTQGRMRMASEDPDSPENFPRNLFVWRSNLLGSSAKGHEYFLRHLLGCRDGAMGSELGIDEERPEEVVWREAPKGKLDLLVTLDFRMSTTCLHSDVVLPTATWYEKNDLNTSDMHPFIHPLSEAVNPAWEARSDWAIFTELAKEVSRLSSGHLGVEKDLVLTPILHDTPGELAQPDGGADWKSGQCPAEPGRTMPNMTVVERDYPNLWRRMTSLGPLVSTVGNGGKGLAWKTDREVKELAELNGTVTQEGPWKGRPCIETDIQAIETILRLAPETNGNVAVKAWESLGKATGREHTHLAIHREDERVRFRDLQAQPRKIISSPIWSGVESEEVCYTAGWTNVNERIPWRTLTGRQQLYQDHPWMRAYGEGFAIYRPPVDTGSLRAARRPNGNPEIVLNFLTPHQKWGIHSTYTDNLLMLTLGRGGPCVWLSEVDAAKASISDNDWVEVYNTNGALAARAIVSQRIPEGAVFMYHAQEKTINTPLAESTGTRGIHNSVARIVLKPTHMVGAYAHQAWGFNYIGTIGTNRDEFVVVRRMDTVRWEGGEA